VLYPVYVVVLRIVLLWVMVPVFVLIVGPIVIATAANPTVGAIQTVWNLAMADVFSLGVITLVFAILERRPLKELANWDPRKLPRVPLMKALPDVRQPIPRATAIAELIFGIICTGVCLQAAWYLGGFNLDVVHIVLAPVWRLVYPLVLLYCVAGIPLGWVGLVWPARIRLRSVIRLAINAIGLIVIGVLAQAGILLTLTSSKLSTASLADATHWTSLGVHIFLGAAAIVTFMDMAQEIRRCLTVRW
jgi:hypothetical protein